MKLLFSSRTRWDTCVCARCDLLPNVCFPFGNCWQNDWIRNVCRHLSSFLTVWWPTYYKVILLFITCMRQSNHISIYTSLLSYLSSTTTALPSIVRVKSAGKPFNTAPKADRSYVISAFFPFCHPFSHCRWPIRRIIKLYPTNCS